MKIGLVDVMTMEIALIVDSQVLFETMGLFVPMAGHQLFVEEMGLAAPMAGHQLFVEEMGLVVARMDMVAFVVGAVVRQLMVVDSPLGVVQCSSQSIAKIEIYLYPTPKDLLRKNLS